MSTTAGVATPFVTERFELNVMTQLMLKNRPEPWAKGYGAFSEFVFQRTYARDGESWWLVVKRVIEGVFSIRKTHYARKGLAWDEEAMQYKAHEMALSAYDGEWGPPGRGYWAGGVEKLIYAKGGMALNNCGYCDIIDLGRDVHWAMDGLMMGVGIGFSTDKDVLTGLELPRSGGIRYTASHLDHTPEPGYVNTLAYHQAREYWDGAGEIVFVVPDSREGWCDSVRLLLDSYRGGPKVVFDYNKVRPRGAKIEGFGGEASGPWPLRKLHRQLRTVMDSAARAPQHWSNSQLITDIINFVGCCIVAGNVRRSATIALGSPDDPTFPELKHYCDGYDPDGTPINPTKYWYRRRHGWMSNNSYVLSETRHFEQTIPAIADGIKRNGEPGFYNLKAVRKYGRLGDEVGKTLSNGTELRYDFATGINPCGEVPLESYELCCLAEWYPTRCLTADGAIDRVKAIKAAAHAAFYTQTVQLLMTHRPETNRVIERNRRTGVSLAGAASLRDLGTMSQAIALMEIGYDTIRAENKYWSAEAQVPEAIRVTAEKPSGTTSLMMGVPAGAHWPTAPYIRRAARVDNGRAQLRAVLDAAGVPHEPDLVSANTEVYYFPVKTPGTERVRPVQEVSMWEQADFAVTLAQHFVDNAVSVTVTYDPLTRAEKEAMSTTILAQYAVVQEQLELSKATHEWEYGDDAMVLVERIGEPDAELAAQAERLMRDFVALQRRTPEGDDVERLVASYIGKLKSMSMLPRSGHGYLQAPETAITAEEYARELARLGTFDWSSFHDQGLQEVYCASCETV